MNEYDFGSNFDLGSFDDIAAVDFGGIGGLDLPSDFASMASDIDTSGIDFGSLGLEGALNWDDLDLGDLAAISDMELGQGDFDQVAPPANIADLMASMGSGAQGNLADIDFDSIYTEGMTPEQLLYRQEMLDLGGQNFGESVDLNRAMDDFNANLQGIYDQGGFTSQWQNVDGRKVQVYDDGTGMAVNPSTGASRSLSQSEVTSLINAGKLNTAASGYNAATGGTNTAAGGGVSVTLRDGSTGTLLSNGRVIDSSGTVVGNTGDVKTVTTNTGDKTTDVTKTVDGTRTTSTPTTPRTTTSTKDGLGALLPLLLALLAMNKGGGGRGGGQNAVIPGLTATQRQTPYGQQQRAPGYRPGQGGISYFEPTQFAPRMAAGGGIGSLDRGRLLDGPGDGVSDSIPAVIDDGLAKGGQPAKLARGEYVIDARTVAALGNGSTDAGAERLDKMRKKILRDDRKAGVGKDSKAYRHLLA